MTQDSDTLPADPEGKHPQDNTGGLSTSKVAPSSSSVEPIAHGHLEVEGLGTPTQQNPSLKDDSVHAQLMKDSEPMWLTDLMVERPCTLILLSIAGLLAVTIAAVGLDFFAINPDENRDFLIWDDPITVDWDMQVVGEQYVLAKSGASKEKPLQMTQMKDWNPLILYRSKEGANLLDKDLILKIAEVESHIREIPNWKKVCLAASISDTTCSPSSFTSSLAFIGDASISDLTQDQIDEAWSSFRASPEFKLMGSLYPKESLLAADEGELQFMRSFMSFGLPLQVNGIRYEDILDRQTEQREFIREFQKDILDYLAEWEGDENFSAEILSFDVTQVIMTEIVESDMQWALASLLFVLVYFIIKMQSAFLGFYCIFVILMSFPTTQLVNEGIFRNTYYSSLHTMVIFIVLGIGADDVFVFMDGFRQTRSIKEVSGDPRKRMALAVRRAARATATTSSTTSVAFLANAFSPIMPIKSFGIYAAIIIVTNYKLINLMLPPAAIWYERNLEGKWCLWSRPNTANADAATVGDTEAEGTLERFFGCRWNSFVHRARLPIIGVFSLWAIIALVFALKLTPLTRSEQFLADDHPIMESQNVQTENFGSGGVFNLAVDIYWGVKGIDKSKASMWDPVYIGEAEMDESFSFETPEAQQSLLDLCAELKAREDIVLNKEVQCWIEGFSSYMEAQGFSLPLRDAEEFNRHLSEWASNTQAGRTAQAAMMIGFLDGKLSYMKIQTTSQGDPLAPYDLKYPYYEAWEKLLAEYKAKAPASMQSARQTAGQYWALMPLEKAFISSAFQGMGIATAFAFIVLLIATGNLIQALLSLVCVAIVIVSVLAIMQFQGWEIGISESICMVILIGFSVDYCVHLSADYMHSAQATREKKMKQAFSEMGVSIFSGAITTFGSGVFLFGGEIIMFNKFALLITSTIAISFLTSMMLFGALMHTVGPEEGTGDLKKICPTGKGETK